MKRTEYRLRLAFPSRLLPVASYHTPVFGYPFLCAWGPMTMKLNILEKRHSTSLHVDVGSWPEPLHSKLAPDCTPRSSAVAPGVHLPTTERSLRIETMLRSPYKPLKHRTCKFCKHARSRTARNVTQTVLRIPLGALFEDSATRAFAGRKSKPPHLRHGEAPYMKPSNPFS